MNAALDELKVACPQCGLHVVVNCAELSLQATCPGCEHAFLPAEADRVRSDGTVGTPLGSPVVKVAPTPTSSESDKLAADFSAAAARPSVDAELAERTACRCMFCAYLAVAVAFIALVVGFADRLSRKGSGASAFVVCGVLITLTFWLGLIGQLARLRATIIRKK